MLVSQSRGATDIRFNFPKHQAILNIKLKKTIRVKNSKKPAELPPNNGNFNYYFDENNKRIVPIAHNNEALWLDFRFHQTVCPLALKVFAGGINAITGEKEDESTYHILRGNDATGKGQNYMLLPGQQWLDGFTTATGEVSQFIAVKMGSGKSAEEKLENTQRGGLQFIVIPTKQALVDEALVRIEQEKKRQEDLDAAAGIQKDKTEIELVDAIDYRRSQRFFSVRKIISKLAKIKIMGLGAGGKIYQDIYASKIPIDDFDTAQAQYADLELTYRKNINVLRQPTAEEYTNAGGLWYRLISDKPVVSVDPASRLVTQQAAGTLSALPQEASLPIPRSQIFNIFHTATCSFTHFRTRRSASLSSPLQSQPTEHLTALSWGK